MLDKKKRQQSKSLSNSSSEEDIYSKFQGMSKKRIKQKQEEISYGDKLPVIKFAPNKVTRIRILPTRKGYDDFFLDTSLHWSLGEKQNQVRTCRKVFGLECPFCNLVDKLNSSLVNMDFSNLSEKKAEIKKASIKDRIRKISASRRILVYGVDMDDLEKGVQQIPLPISVLQEILDIISDDYDGVDVVSDPINGHVLNIKRKGSGMTDTKYRVTLGEQWKVPKEILKALLNAKPLEIEKPENIDTSKDEVLVDETAQHFDDVLVFSKVKKKVVKKVQSEDEYDEDEYDEDVDEDDEEVEEDVDEDEEEIDDDDEDDEDDDDEDDEDLDEDDDDEDEDDDEDFDEDEDEDEEDEEDEDEDEEEVDDDDEDEEDEDKEEKKNKSKISKIKSIKDKAGKNRRR